MQPPNTTFTPGWSAYENFVRRAKAWEDHIVPALAGMPARWLELGSFEGRSALWTLDNILTHEDAQIVCVDQWKGGFEATFDANLGQHPHRAKVTKVKDQCFSAIRRMQGLFDCVFIDADHQAKAALTEAAMVWPLLKPGGFLIFDDYPWQLRENDPHRDKKLPPGPGIDAFLHCWQHELKILHKEWQVIIQKL